MQKLLLFPVLLAFACILAGAYGAIHNQISYTVAPSYFHDFKFRQFGIDPSLENRVGAAWVGVLASWWMGIIIGIPVYLCVVWIRPFASFLRAYLTASVIVVCITLLTGLVGLAYAWLTLSETTLPYWMQNRDVSEPLRFALAGSMHNHSYLGGLLGLLAAVLYCVWQIRRSAKRSCSDE